MLEQAGAWRSITTSKNYTSVKHTLQDAWADWLRKIEPFDWFTTLTFKKDIQTFSRENPSIYQHNQRVALVSNFSDWSNTRTYYKDVQESFARQQYLRWVRLLSVKIYGRRFMEKGLGVDHAYGMEFQKRGVIHVHAVLKGIPKTESRIMFERAWEQQHPCNGFANTYPYDPKLGAVGYLAKYITKGGEVDLWLSKRTLGQVQRVEVVPANHLL